MTKQPREPTGLPAEPPRSLLDELDDDSEEVRDADPVLFCNDPFLNGLVEAADRANYRNENATKIEILVYLDHAERLRLAEEHGLEGAQLVAFGKRILPSPSGRPFGRTKIYEIRQLAEFAEEILATCKVQRGQAIAKGQIYSYPTWKEAWSWYFEKPKKPKKPVEPVVAEQASHVAAGPAAPDAGAELVLGVAHDLLAEQLAEANMEIRDLKQQLASAAKPVAEPVAELVAEPVEPAASTPPAGPVAEPEAEPLTKSVADVVAEPVAPAVAEPAAERLGFERAAALFRENQRLQQENAELRAEILRLRGEPPEPPPQGAKVIEPIDPAPEPTPPEPDPTPPPQVKESEPEPSAGAPTITKEKAEALLLRLRGPGGGELIAPGDFTAANKKPLRDKLRAAGRYWLWDSPTFEEAVRAVLDGLVPDAPPEPEPPQPEPTPEPQPEPPPQPAPEPAADMMTLAEVKALLLRVRGPGDSELLVPGDFRIPAELREKLKLVRRHWKWGEGLFDRISARVLSPLPQAPRDDEPRDLPLRRHGRPRKTPQHVAGVPDVPEGSPEK